MADAGSSPAEDYESDLVTKFEVIVVYKIKRGDEYLAVIDGREYPRWTTQRSKSRSFSSLRSAQLVIETWKLENAQVVPCK